MRRLTTGSATRRIQGWCGRVEISDMALTEIISRPISAAPVLHAVTEVAGSGFPTNTTALDRRHFDCLGDRSEGVRLPVVICRSDTRDSAGLEIETGRMVGAQGFPVMNDAISALQKKASRG